jgi:hypothetical protein
LIHCAIVPAIQETLVINVPRRTVLALTQVEVEVHSPGAGGVQVLAEFGDVVVGLARFAVLA